MKHVPIDKHEAVMMIQTYLDWQAGKYHSRIEAAQALSARLRQKAVNQGIEIDSVFRNQAGMEMYLMRVRYLFTGKGGMKGAQQLLKDTVDCSCSTPEVFQTYVDEAMELATRIPWDKYETALLFDFYTRIESGSNMRSVATQLSETLRIKAEKQGLEIDEKFRNVNGMLMKLENVRYLITDGTSGLSSVSQGIKDMYKLKNQHPDEYEEIRREAWKMASGTDVQAIQVAALAQQNDPEQRKRTARANYLEWLKGQGVDADMIGTYRILILRCDDFVAKNRISTKGVLLEENPDALEVTYAALKKSLSFRSQPNANYMLTALKRYIAFREVASSKYKYVLHAFDNNYTGSTPAHALSLFLSDFVLWYPTCLYRIVGRSWKSKVFITSARKSIRDYQIGKQSAFLTHTITRDDATEYANWLCNEFELNSIVVIEEIVKSAMAPEPLKNPHGEGISSDAKTDGSMEHTSAAVSTESKEPKDIQTILTAYEQWLIAQKALSPKSAVVYRQTLKSLPTAVDCNDVDMTLLSAPAPVIEAALNKCLEAAEFGRGRASQFRCSVMAYLEFIGQYDSGNSGLSDVMFPDVSEDNPATNTEETERITEILSERFANGLRKESFIDLRKFKKAWEEKTGAEYLESDENLKKVIASLCIDTEERWYLPSALLSDEDKERLDRELFRFFDGKRHILYISQLYDTVQTQLTNKLVTPELFGLALRSQYRKKYYFSRDVIADAANVRLDIAKEIENELVSAGRPVTVNILQERLGYIPADRIEKELKNNSHFIRNTRDKETGGEFFHDSMLRITGAEALEIVDIINGCILRDDYALRGDVLKRISSGLPEMAERITGYSGYGVWEVIRRRLVNRFSFTDTVACKLGVWLTNTDLLTMFCKNRTPFTWEEYKDFAREIGAQQNSKIAQQYAFRVSQNQYISKSDITFQVDQADSAVSLYFVPDSIPVEDILSFDAFPSCGYPWNHYLLEQYILERSQKYCLDGGGNYGLSGTIRLR